MLKRIKKIQQIGEFKNASHCEFGRTVLVYGLNGYGKSTFSDICRSLNSADITILKNRETIDSNNRENDQELIFSFTDSKLTEIEVCFKDNQWKKNSLPYDIEVFDSKFIEENIFTGLTISRPNRENLTNLILGEENVDLAKNVASLKQEQSKINQRYSDTSDSLKKTLGLLNLGVFFEDFIKLEKIDDIENLRVSITKLEEEKRKMSLTVKKADIILSLPIPKIILFDLDISILLTNAFSVLERSFDELDKDALSKLQLHIKQHFKEHDGYEEEWVKKGLAFCCDEDDKSKKYEIHCPFCGQDLKNAKELVDTYRKYFGEAYKNYYSILEKDIKDGQNKTNDYIFKLNSIIDQLKNNLIHLNKYREYFSEGDIEKLEELSNITSALEKCIIDYQSGCDKTIKKLGEFFQLKLKTPFERIDASIVDKDKLVEDQNRFFELLKQYGTNIEYLLNHSIRNLKEGVQNQSLKQELEDVVKLLEGLTIKQKRYELDSEVEILLKLKDEKEKTESLIKQKQTELQAENDQFVQGYFEKASKLFNSLGAINFQISENFSRRGNQPVYGFTIKFKGKDITDNLIPFVFSDADRRALALAIFLSKLEAKKISQGNLKNTIIVLDDPVTSFDDNRISSTILKIKELIKESRQVIILSHYRGFLKKVYDSICDIEDLKLIKICREENGSCFNKIEDINIELDEYAKLLDEVEKFVEGSNHDSVKIRMSLRNILQKEIEWRYRRQLFKISYNGLGSLVDGLKNTNIISVTTASKLNGFNSILKEDHHNINNNSPEDTRNLAKEILDFIFNEMNQIENLKS